MEGFMKKILYLVLAVSLLATLVGCGGSDSSASAPAPAPAPTTATLKTVNDSSSTMNQIFVSRSTVTTWGADQLSSLLYPGGTHTLTGIPCGQNIDFRAVSTTSGTWTRYNQYVSCGSTFTWTLLN
jgi:hypothetical protein